MMAASLSSTHSSSRLSSAFPTVPVICEEIFDESCQPSEQEINDYAALIGIDPIKESHLLYLAKEGLMQALPADWKICYSEEKCGHYYYNTKTRKSQWDHPLDEIYRNLANQARQKHTLSGNTGNTVTPIIDNSDDVSQLDSGIRSLPVTDECDNTNNTNEMSSPSVANLNNGAIPKQTVNTTNNSSVSSISTSGFSVGINRFLESRSKNITSPFVPLKNNRFELSKIYTTNDLLVEPDKFVSKFSMVKQNVNGSVVITENPIKFPSTIFLKSRSQIEGGINETINDTKVIVEGTATPPPGVKSILRDSSLTDVGRRLEKEDQNDGGSVNIREDKKSVRFHFEEGKLRNSPEEDGSSSRRLTQSPEISANSDDDAEENDDPWDGDDDEEELNECIGITNLPLDGLINYRRNLNPFVTYEEEKINDNKLIQISKLQTTQTLKRQNSSTDTQEPNNLHEMQSMPQSTESSSATQVISPVSFAEKRKDSGISKPMYEDTDSESKGSSIRSFIINKSEQGSVASACPPSHSFDLDELDRQHSHEVKQLEIKLNNNNSDRVCQKSFKAASKLVNLFKKEDVKPLQQESVQFPVTEENQGANCKTLNVIVNEHHQLWLKNEKAKLEYVLQSQIEDIKREHEQKLKSVCHEYDLRLTSHQHQMAESIDLRLQEYRNHLENELNTKRKVLKEEHKTHMETLKKNHSEILLNLQRDLKSEEDILKKEHLNKLAEMREEFNHQMELEKQRMRDIGEDQLYEKVRCEKRLLEDKYRCLKEKYTRLKTDVKLSMERRNRRREAQAIQKSAHTTTTTGSETERSMSNKPSIGNSENRSLSYSTSNQNETIAKTGMGGKCQKPLVPPKLHLESVKDQLPKADQFGEWQTTVSTSNRKLNIASKYIRHLQSHDDTTSVSQSDTTLSNNYSKGRYLSLMVPHIIGNNGNIDSEAFQSNQENNNNPHNAGVGGTPQRKKQFSRLKSASTSRLNTDNYKNDRPCTPVENLRHQLKKLEDLEDQFPENTRLDTTYHLRYPFSDISNADYAGGTSSELEFFKHRIHLERDSVRRAKESLRCQRTNFRLRQKEIKQRHKAMTIRHSLDQLIQEEKELTEMEVSLHRTRALLGEKVIRLRHLEQSLLRVCEREKPSGEVSNIEQKEDATLSDLSSHSSSGFSSTEYGSAGDTQNLNKRKDIYQLNSKDCIKHLEILNAEIKDILDILAGKGVQNSGLPIPLISPSELNWSNLLNSGTLPVTPLPITSNHNISQQQSWNNSGITLNQTLHSIPTLADRLEAYRQLASGRMQTSLVAANTIVSQNPRAINYTISLVERTRDLRNWLRQAKNEHELFFGMTNTLSLSGTHVASDTATSALREVVTLANDANNSINSKINL